jgi:hypothetical protein
MYVTLNASCQGYPPRSASNYPTLAVSPSPNLPSCREATSLSPTRALLESASLAILPPAGAPPPYLGWPFVCVAYFLLAHSRLGFSPNLGYDTAYHTTNCIFPGNTKRCLDKNFCAPPPRFPSASQVWPGLRCYLFRSPVGQGGHRVGESWRRLAEEFPPFGFHVRSMQKRSK